MPQGVCPSGRDGPASRRAPFFSRITPDPPRVTHPCSLCLEPNPPRATHCTHASPCVPFAPRAHAPIRASRRTPPAPRATLPRTMITSSMGRQQVDEQMFATICFMCFRCMLHMFHLDVVKVDLVLHMLQWLYIYVENVCFKCSTISNVGCKCMFQMF